jgi:hypothetical protein
MLYLMIVTRRNEPQHANLISSVNLPLLVRRVIEINSRFEGTRDLAQLNREDSLELNVKGDGAFPHMHIASCGDYFQAFNFAPTNSD